MQHVEFSSDEPRVSPRRNVGWMLRSSARAWPERLAVAFPRGRDRQGKRTYRTVSFQELDQTSDRIAQGLLASGVEQGSRVAMMVPQSIEFITLVFALFKAGMVQVLIDPGMGKKNMLRCLAEAEPEALIGIPKAHLALWIFGRRFPKLRHRICVGSPRFPGSTSLQSLMDRNDLAPPSLDPVAYLQSVEDRTDAAIIFTTGSTGPPKGVLYQHLTFRGQATEVQRFYDIAPGEIDLPGFPLFALFNAAMGVSTVIPEMDPTRPADINPASFIEIANDFQVTQSFGSPALWNTVGRYCEKQSGRPLPSIKKVFSAGAPVPPHVLQRVIGAIAPSGEMHTPYGATEALPVASNSASIVLGETAELTRQGKGTCVGSRFHGIEWRVIAIDDGPLATLDQTQSLPAGEIGELMVTGSVVTERYVTRVDANALHKVRDGERIWHRMGDVGYLDSQDRFWFCGRKAHRVQTAQGTLFTIPCESIANAHPSIYRSALVGIGPVGSQTAVIIVEPWPEKFTASQAAQKQLIQEVKQLLSANPLTDSIQQVLVRRKLPVDIRHNSKIFREQLAPWAAKCLKL